MASRKDFRVDRSADPRNAKLTVRGGDGLAHKFYSNAHRCADPRFNALALGPSGVSITNRVSAFVGTSEAPSVGNPSTTAGELILVVYSMTNDVNSLGLSSGPTGFTVVTGLGGGGYRDDRFSYAWKISDGTEPSTLSFTETEPAGRGVITAFALSGVNVTNPLAAAEFQGYGAGSTISTDAPASSGDFYMGFLAHGSPVATTPPGHLYEEAYMGPGDPSYQQAAASAEDNTFTWTYSGTAYPQKLVFAINASI